MTNPTPEAIEALVKRLLTEVTVGSGVITGLRIEAADMLTALSQRAPDPTGGWCSDIGQSTPPPPPPAPSVPLVRHDLRGQEKGGA